MKSLASEGVIKNLPRTADVGQNWTPDARIVLGLVTVEADVATRDQEAKKGGTARPEMVAAAVIHKTRLTDTAVLHRRKILRDDVKMVILKALPLFVVLTVRIGPQSFGHLHILAVLGILTNG